MADIIDVSFNCGSQAGFLAGAGVKTVIRYYSRNTSLPAKRLTRSEALQFDAVGIRLGIVHEAKRGDLAESFSFDLGASDGDYARGYGAKTIDQPANSAIYFGVDFDATAEQIEDRILPFFRGVAESFGSNNGLPGYKVGVYGSGSTCAAVLDAGLAQFSWLAQSKGWANYKAFLNSKRWALLQAASSRIGEIECDPDRSNGDFGDFALGAISGTEIADGAPRTVIARPGLRLRAGPGTDFDVLQIIPFGATVRVVKSVGDWAMIDLIGDRAADGFANAHFLEA